MTFTREVLFKAAYDKRHVDPSKNYGIHGLHIWFNLRHSSGEGISFSVSTNWMLSHLRDTLPNSLSVPLAFGVDLHRKIPQYDGHTPIKDCHITGGDCYSDGSALLGEEFLETLIAGGDEALWKRLEEQYIAWGGAQ